MFNKILAETSLQEIADRNVNYDQAAHLNLKETFAVESIEQIL